MIASNLRRFYGSLKSKAGKEYSKSAYVSIRSGINRHLTSPPHNRQINIMHDRDFMSANHVFAGVLREFKLEGKDQTEHKSSILPGDMQKMYATQVLGSSTPLALQRKVFVELMLHFGRRGREGLRDLTKTSFNIKCDDNDVEYVTMAYNELDKNHQKLLSNEPEKAQIMYAQKNDPLCPILSFRKYISKLNPNCDAFFQRPKQKFHENDAVWYENKPVGVNTIGNIMKGISTDAGLSQMYTNHCLRATCATVLAKAGVEARDICAVTGHHNETSLKSYISGPDLQKRNEMSTVLSSYGKPVASSSAGAEVLMGQAQISGPDSAFVSSHGRTIVNRPTGGSVSQAFNSTQSGININYDPQVFRPNTQSSSSMFGGANFYGATNITINMATNPKL